MEALATATLVKDDDDEASLLDGLRAGDDAAYETLVRRYGGRLLAVARRILRNEEDARDAVQDAFLAAFRNLDRFEGSARLSSWLHRIVANAALTKLRRRQHHAERSIDDWLPRFQPDGHPTDWFVSWGESSSQALQRLETRALVREAIDQLPDSYRTVLLLRDIEGMDTGDAAELLGTTEGVVKVRLHRARQALRTILDPHFREGTL